MNALFKWVGLLAPPIRRIHAQRDEYARRLEANAHQNEQLRTKFEQENSILSNIALGLRAKIEQMEQAAREQIERERCLLQERNQANEKMVSIAEERAKCQKELDLQKTEINQLRRLVKSKRRTILKFRKRLTSEREQHKEARAIASIYQKKLRVAEAQVQGMIRLLREERVHNAVTSTGQSRVASLSTSSNFERNQSLRKLHIIGFARSGTTITMDILNSSPDVFIFNELNLHALRHDITVFRDYGGDNFLEQFLARKMAELPQLYKGAIVPDVIESFSTPDELITALMGQFQYVGDKIALAARDFSGRSDIELIDEFVRRERNATLIFCLRKPSEILYSVSKMFPGANIAEWFDCICRYMNLALRAFLHSNSAMLVFHAGINCKLISDLETVLGINCQISINAVGRKFQHKSIDYPSEISERCCEIDVKFIELENHLTAGEIALVFSRTDFLVKKIAEFIRFLEQMADLK
ncbi:hypothetical protein [Permianibacter aggregans]|uniref:Sulfotransferase family protein n=1 Tax=Permianibacter aggregans TaxID=1510150 RepID=A0A4R6UV77_9GAMM|nr:hypothetical protein [Permianibacter aggregans]QGX41335.1 hypothetical protein E2H98_17345 [Permianibacter aggregans]TDQ51121.1 hypothetical protein EV696_10190 [Permianibacter aggregans]